jgi:hypothetical protein
MPIDHGSFQHTSSISKTLPSCSPRSSFKVRPNSSSSISKQTLLMAGSYRPLLSSSRMNASIGQYCQSTRYTGANVLSEYNVQHTLGPSHLVKAKQDTLVMKRLANQISSFRWNMIIVLPENLQHPVRLLHHLTLLGQNNHNAETPSKRIASCGIGRPYHG